MAREWMEIAVERAGDELLVTAQGSRDERPPPHPLGPGLTSARLAEIEGRVRLSASRQRPIDAHNDETQVIHRALFREGLRDVLLRLREAAGGSPVLLRLMLRDAALQAFPWEALCEPGTQRGFLGTSPDILPVRGVTASEPRGPHNPKGPVRLLAIAPFEAEPPDGLKSALYESIASGAVTWLDPIVGAKARPPYLFECLRRGPAPHVLHFIGHGDIKGGRVPVLRLADGPDGEESWIEVELFAQELRESYRDELRLIVLQACEGARSAHGAPDAEGTAALASAAELFARSAAEAVVAHLWPVKADVARAFSMELYRALTGAERGRGDVAASLGRARRTVLSLFGGSAEAFSPVLYLRGREGVLFESSESAPPAVDRGPPGASRGAPAPAPAPIALAGRASKPAVRKLLDLVLTSDSQLDAFVSDFFPKVKLRFTDGMERVRKVTLLLEGVGVVRVVEKLREQDPEAVAEHEHVLG